MKKIVICSIFILLSIITLSRHLPGQALSFGKLGKWETGVMADSAVEGSYAYCVVYNAGLYVVDISNPAAPKQVGALEIENPLQRIAVSGNYVYITSYWRQSLYIVDISTPSSPVHVSTFNNFRFINDVAVQGNYVYLASGYVSGAITIVDVSDPSAPVEKGRIQSLQDISDIAVKGNYAYTCSSVDYDDGKFVVFDVSNAPTLKELSRIDLPGPANDLVIGDGYAYVADGKFGMHIIDITDANAPVITGNFNKSAESPGSLTVSVKGNYAYLADDGLNMIDISDPANPFTIKQSESYEQIKSINLMGDYAYISDYFQGLLVMDLSQSNTTPLAGRFDPTNSYPRQVHVSGNYAYVANNNRLQVVDISNESKPRWEGGYYLDQWEQLNDLKFKNKHAFFLTRTDMHIVDIADPTTPAPVSITYLFGGEAIAVSGNYAYVTGFLGDYYFKVFDISTPAYPALVKKVILSDLKSNILISGNYAYLAGRKGLDIFDISNPASPTLAGSFSQLGDINAICQNSAKLYVAYKLGGQHGLAALDITVPISPTVMGTINTTAYYELAHSDGIVYAPDRGLHAYDFYNPGNPRKVGHYTPDGLAIFSDVSISGGKIYVVNENLHQLLVLSASYSSGLSLDTGQLNFITISPATSTVPQTFSINNTGAGPMNWTISQDAGWFSCTPNQGSSGGAVSVTVDGTGLTPGKYSGTITVTAQGVQDSPQTVTVNFTIYNPQQLSGPFGEISTPVENSQVSSSIAVTGWALDDIGIENVKIYRGSGKNLVYIGDAILVPGARPDVQAAYPDYPGNDKAGWGYMLLTNFLPGGGNGTFILHAIAEDTEGNRVTLGKKIIHCDNANAVKPFGAIDTPTQGGIASGNQFINWGWALTPSPKKIPIDGFTIDVWVDGVKLGHPTYNIYREDIAALFPGYANSGGAIGYFYLDTFQYTDGVHTIQWTVRDDAGENDGIGSRYFTVQNNNPRTRSMSSSKAVAMNLKPMNVKHGFAASAPPKTIHPDDEGNFYVEMEALGRLEIHLEPGTRNCSPLPAGSNLNCETGVFTFAPGVAFLGLHRMVFIDVENRKSNITVNITTGP